MTEQPPAMRRRPRLRLPRPLRQSEKHRERPMNLQHDIAADLADGWADLGTPNRLRTVDGDLRRQTQAGPVAWRDIDPGYAGLLQAAGKRQHNDGGECVEPVGLDDDRRPWFAAVALQGNDDDVAPAYQPRSSHASALTCSQNSASVRPASVCSAAAIASHWRRHSAANPAALVSGTQIWTGRRPAARILSRRRLTRSALVALPMPLHVAPGRPGGNRCIPASPLIRSDSRLESSRRSHAQPYPSRFL